MIAFLLQSACILSNNIVGNNFFCFMLTSFQPHYGCILARNHCIMTALYNIVLIFCVKKIIFLIQVFLYVLAALWQHSDCNLAAPGCMPALSSLHSGSTLAASEFIFASFQPHSACIQAGNHCNITALLLHSGCIITSNSVLLLLFFCYCIFVVHARFVLTAFWLHPGWESCSIVAVLQQHACVKLPAFWLHVTTSALHFAFMRTAFSLRANHLLDASWLGTIAI